MCAKRRGRITSRKPGGLKKVVLKVCSFNVNSFEASKHIIREIDQIHEPDVFLIQEAAKANTEKFKFRGFDCIFTPSFKDIKNPSVYDKKRQLLTMFRAKTVESIKQTDTSNETLPVQQFTIRMTGSDQNITITNIYKPHDQTLDPEWDIITNSCHNIIGGDFNSSLEAEGTPGSVTDNKKLSLFMETNHLTNHNTNLQPTNHHKRNNRAIDYIFTDPVITPSVKSFQVLEHWGSKKKDGSNLCQYHDPILLEIEYFKKDLTRPTFNYNKFNSNQYKKDLKTNIKKYPFTSINSIDEIEKEAKNIENIILSTVKNQLEPEVTRYKNGWTPSTFLTQLMELKNHCLKKANKKVKWYARAIWLNKANHIGYLSRELYKLESRYHDQISCDKLCKEPLNSAKFWATVKRLSGIKTTTYSCRELKYNKKTAMGRQEKADLHLEYQEEVFSENKAGKCTQCDNCANDAQCTDVDDYWREKILPDYEEGQRILREEWDDEIPEITMREIKTAIKNTHKLKAGGKNDIKPICLHEATDELIERIRALFNSCLKQKYIPKSWKHAMIILLPKANKDHSKPDGYRPISLLDVVGKLFDKIMANRYRKFLNAARDEEGRELIPPQQRGFTSGAQTNDLLFNLQQNICDSFQNDQQTLIAALDATKAFDKAPHQAILGAISQLVATKQMPKYILGYYTAFLKDRKFQIKLPGCESQKTATIRAGVPQGSVSAPHLYLHLTATIPRPDEQLNRETVTEFFNKNKEGKGQYLIREQTQQGLEHLRKYPQELGIFADDTATWARITTKKVFGNVTFKRKLSIDRFQIYLNKIFVWANRLKIKFNVDKNQLMITKPLQYKTKTDSKPALKLGPMDLNYKNELTYLGIVYDEDLKLSSYLKDINRRCRSRLGKIYHLSERANIHPYISHNWQMTLVVPIFMYGLIAWYPDIKKREKMKKLYTLGKRYAYRIPKGSLNRSLVLRYCHKEKDFFEWCEKILSKWYNKSQATSKMVKNFTDRAMTNRRLHPPIPKKARKSKYTSILETCHDAYKTQ